MRKIKRANLADQMGIKLFKLKNEEMLTLPVHKLVIISPSDSSQHREQLKQLFNNRENLYFASVKDFITYAQENKSKYIFDVLQHKSFSEGIPSELVAGRYKASIKDKIFIGFYLFFDDFDFVYDQESLKHIVSLLKYYNDEADVSSPIDIIRSETNQQDKLEVNPANNSITNKVVVIVNPGEYHTSQEIKVRNFIKSIAELTNYPFELVRVIQRPELPTTEEFQSCMLLNLTGIPIPASSYNDCFYIVNTTFNEIEIAELQETLTHNAYDFYSDNDGKTSAVAQFYITREQESLFRQGYNYLLYLWNEQMNPSTEALLAKQKEVTGKQPQYIGNDSESFYSLIFVGLDVSEDTQNFHQRLQKFFNVPQCLVFKDIKELHGQLRMTGNRIIFNVIDFTNSNPSQLIQDRPFGFYINLLHWNDIANGDVYKMLSIFKNLLEQNLHYHYINYSIPSNPF